MEAQVPHLPKILNLLSDHRTGGIQTSLNNLMNSRLQQKFEFAIAPLNRASASIRNLQPDLIIVHDACSWKILPNLLKLKLLKGKAKLIIQDHHYSEAFERYKVPNLPRFRLMLKLCHWLCDRLLLVSYAQTEWMLKYQLIRGKKLTVIQQSVNCDRFLALPPKALANPPVFVAYGRFNEQKGFDVLLKAIKLISDLKFRLLLAGYGADEAWLRELAIGSPQIEFVGKVDDVPAFLAQSDVVIIPSRWEPWGNVCLEAKAARKPVIVSAVDGLVEQVRGLGCGICVLPDDPQILAEAIAQFCQQIDQNSLNSWGKEARESVKNAWEEYLNAWEDLLCQLLAK